MGLALGPRFLPKPTTAAQERRRLQRERTMSVGFQLLQSADRYCCNPPTKPIAARGRRGSPQQRAGLGTCLITGCNDATNKSSDKHDCQQGSPCQDTPGPQHCPSDKDRPLVHCTLESCRPILVPGGPPSSGLFPCLTQATQAAPATICSLPAPTVLLAGQDPG